MTGDLGRIHMTRIESISNEHVKKSSPKSHQSIWDRGCRVSADLKEISTGDELIDDIT